MNITLLNLEQSTFRESRCTFCSLTYAENRGDARDGKLLRPLFLFKIELSAGDIKLLLVCAPRARAHAPPYYPQLPENI